MFLIKLSFLYLRSTLTHL